MTKRKLTELVELSTADDADLIHILDVSESVVTNQNKEKVLIIEFSVATTDQ